MSKRTDPILFLGLLGAFLLVVELPIALAILNLDLPRWRVLALIAFGVVMLVVFASWVWNHPFLRR